MKITIMKSPRTRIPIAFAAASLLLAATGCEQKPDLSAAPANPAQSVPSNAPPGTTQAVQGSQAQGQQANQRAAAEAAARQAAQQKSGGK
jgi:hypothetical protein